jgi:hypothetical protein
MQKIKSFFLSLLFLVAFSILGTVIGFGVGNEIVLLNHEGLFTPWKRIDNSHKFKSIVDVTSNSIWAQTTDGIIYLRDSNCYQNPSNCNQWIKVTEMPENIHVLPEQPMIKDFSCPNGDFRLSRKPPGNLIECAQGTSIGEQSSFVYYALLDNEEIWAWKHNISWGSDIVTIMRYSFGGFIVGVITFMFHQTRKNRI